MSIQRGNKNSDAIRILQRDRDASARATHLKAEIGMVPNSTIERKIMSTKTSIKRIALVAAAALTLGGFSAVSAQANLVANGTASASSIEQVANTGDGGVGGVAGPANSLKIVVFNGQTTAAVGNLKAFVTVTGGTISAATDTDTVVASGGTSAVIQPKAAANVLNNSTGADTLTVLTPTAGSLVINVYDETSVGSGLYASTPSSTKTITVNAAGVSGTATVANSTIWDTTTDTLLSAPTASLLTAPTVSAAVASTGVVRYLATFKDANGGSASTAKYTVTISGPGTISGTSSSTGARALSGTAGTSPVWLFGDGTSGTTTITWSVGSTVIGTKTATFYSSTVKSISATTVNKYVGIAATGWSAPLGSELVGQAWVCIVPKDSSGNAIPSGSGLTIASSNTAVVTVSTGTWDATDGCFYPALTGVAAGTASITVKDASTGLITASADVQVVSAVVAAISVKTENATYAPGEKVKVQLTATNSAGTPVADGTYYNLVADTMTATIPFASGSLFDSNANKPTFQNGVAYRSLYAPNFSGPIGINWYLGGTKTLLSAALQATATAATAQTGSFTVTGAGDSSSLAYDAASAATDAANNAYEEAQNATQAASDALAAVKALAVQVKALIALVNKIKAKLKA